MKENGSMGHNKRVKMAAAVLASVLLLSGSWLRAGSDEDEDKPAGWRSPGLAALLSWGPTVAGALMYNSGHGRSANMGLGLVCLGPSLGFFSGGLPGRALLGLALRGGAAGLVYLGWEQIWSDRTSGDILILSGIGLFAGSLLYDLFSVYTAVRNRNLLLPDRTFALAPAYFPRQKGWGIQLTVHLD